MESITKELREWAKTLTHWWYDPVKDEYTYTTGIMPSSIDAIRLDSSILAIADRIDASVADGYMKLPVGEDGEVWHIGDVVEWCDGMTAEVIAVGENTLYYIDDGKDAVDWTQADTKRHHRAQTVEDLLRELVYKWGESTDPDAYISEYAAKLQLADDYTENIGEK